MKTLPTCAILCVNTLTLSAYFWKELQRHTSTWDQKIMLVRLIHEYTLRKCDQIPILRVPLLYESNLNCNLTLLDLQDFV